MSLTQRYRGLFRPTLFLETNWRNFFGKRTRFPRSFGQLVVDSDVCYNDGQRGILLLLIQRVDHQTPDEALIGIVDINGSKDIVVHQQRVSVFNVHPVSSHGGPGHEAEPSQS